MPDALEPTAGSFLDAARLIAAGTWHALVVDAVDPAALAVADLLVTEAGGRVTDSLGRPLKHIGVVSHGSIAISNAIDHEHVLRWTH
jgi:fructose-1,6-bisphosphatase/inositol monophosphatase family enzyme